MADEKNDLVNKDAFMSKTSKESDSMFPLEPWTPSVVPIVIPAPDSDPIYQMISSENYINSLECKLLKLKGKTKTEPTAKEIISSLEKVKDDHMSRYLGSDHTNYHNDYTNLGINYNDPAVSYFDRLLHPEKQPVSGEELIELLKDDALSQKSETEKIDESIELTSVDMKIS